MNENKYPDLLALVKARRSVRAFEPTKVERAKLEYMLEVARLAPSAVNFQPWSFVVVREPERLKALYECYPREWFASAPVCIVVCGDHAASWKRSADNKDFCDVDVAIATEHLALAAAEQELTAELEHSTGFLIDLAEVEYVSSAGLRVFLMLAKRARTQAVALGLCSLREEVEEIFDISGFLTLFALFPGREAGVRALASGER